jgi:hypothetical protein
MPSSMQLLVLVTSVVLIRIAVTLVSTFVVRRRQQGAIRLS